MEENYNLYDDTRASYLDRRYKGAVVKIFLRESRQGRDEGWTGFLICWNPCVIVTVFHPLKYIHDYVDFLRAPTTFEVKFHGDEECHAALAVAWDFHADILVLCCACPLPPFQPTYFVFSDPSLPIHPTSLFSISHPGQRAWRSARGMVSCPTFRLGQFQHFDPEMSIFDHSVQLFPGSSGAPLVDAAGWLRGMQFTEITVDEHAVCVNDIAKATLEEYRQLDQLELSLLDHQINILKLRPTDLKQGMHSSYLNQKLREMLNIDLGANLASSLRQSPAVLSRLPPPRVTLPQQPLHGDEDSSKNVEVEGDMHMIPELDSGLEFSAEATINGDGDPAHILEQIDFQIVNKKEEALTRREILEDVETWMAACAQECWLQEYSEDESRYNSGRVTHLIMKCAAKKARALVEKLPGMVRTLALKTDAWEKEQGTEFIYDGIRLLYLLEEYNVLRHKKEQEHKNQKDQKVLKEPLLVEQEALFRSEPSSEKSQSLEKGSRLSYGGMSDQRLSLGGALLQSPKTDKEPNMLSEDSGEYVEAEVNRLETLKDLVFQKRFELEDICRKTHIISESDSGLEFFIEASITGDGDLAHILEQIELQIANKKEEALSRREIVEKVEKWMAACEEERWLQEYNKDDNRYSSRRGTHLIMKRAETARALVRKLPGMVQTLTLKTDAWEKERRAEFNYDGIRLLSMLEEYNSLRQKEEQEHKNQKEQKKHKVEQEALFRSEPSPRTFQSSEKGSRLSYVGTSDQRLSVIGAVLQSPRRHSLGGALLQSPRTDKLHSIRGTPNTRQSKNNDRPPQNG